MLNSAKIQLILPNCVKIQLIRPNLRPLTQNASSCPTSIAIYRRGDRERISRRVATVKMLRSVQITVYKLQYRTGAA